MRNGEIENTVINSPYTENVNLLALDPNGLGAANFTNNGFTSKADVASVLGLPGNALRVTLAGAGNALYYSLAAKLVKFLQGKTITLVGVGYGSASGSDSIQAAFWEDIGTPSYANADNGTSVSVGLVSSSDLTIICHYYTIGASATTLDIGITAGGSSAGATYSIESMKLMLGTIKSSFPGFN